MIEINLIWVLALLTYVAIFTILILIPTLSYKKKHNDFSFLRTFPFEVMADKRFDVILLIFAISSFSSLLITIPLFAEFSSFAIFNVALSFFFGLSGILVATIFKISTKYIRPHLYLSTFLLADAFMSSALVCLHLFLNFSAKNKFNEGGMTLLFAILSAILCLLSMLICFNPKLKNWSQLEERIVNDEKVFDRGKVFPLAYSQYASILIIAISYIFFFLSLIEL